MEEPVHTIEIGERLINYQVEDLNDLGQIRAGRFRLVGCNFKFN